MYPDPGRNVLKFLATSHEISHVILPVSRKMSHYFMRYLMRCIGKNGLGNLKSHETSHEI